MKTLKKTYALAAVAGLVWLGGCSTPDSRIAKHPDVFARLNTEEQSMVRAGRVGIGMDMDAVKLALGNPDRITYQTTNDGQSQVWHYEETIYYDGAYFYPGPYWGPRHPRWGGYWGPGPWAFSEPEAVYDKFRIHFDTTGHVNALRQEAAP